MRLSKWLHFLGAGFPEFFTCKELNKLQGKKRAFLLAVLTEYKSLLEDENLLKSYPGINELKPLLDKTRFNALFGLA